MKYNLYLAEDHVLAVQPRGDSSGDEKLTSVGYTVRYRYRREQEEKEEEGEKKISHQKRRK